MSQNPEVNDNARYSVQQAQIIKVIRFSGVMMILLGTAAFFDLGGVATMIGLGTDNLNQILGGMLMIAGVIEIVVLPRLIEKMK